MTGFASERASGRRQRGWAASEYLAVLVGLMAVWRGSELVLTLVQQHQARFSWTLMIPF